MKIYIAAMYGRMPEMVVVDHRLRGAGHEPTSRWVRGNEEGMTQAGAAAMDLEDIDRADLLLSYTLARGTAFSGGGRHVEFGYGVARGKLLALVGPRENIFHHLPQVVVFSSLDEFLLRGFPS